MSISHRDLCGANRGTPPPQAQLVNIPYQPAWLGSLLFVLFVLLLLFTPCQSNAKCIKSAPTVTKEYNTAQISFGSVNLTAHYLQPAGTLLDTTVVPPTAYKFGGIKADSIVWICDQADLPNIYFLVATNGDDRAGGYWETGKYDGLDAVYATWWEYVGIKQSMSGVDLTRFWKKVPITSYLESKGKINIRLMDIPPLEASIYKISQLPPATGSLTNVCGSMAATGIYTCTQPNSYIQLSGDPIVSFSFGHDQVGQDSSTNYLFWGADNGFGYSMKGSGKLSKAETCVVRNATPHVLLPLITKLSLQEGQTSQANFNVEVECSDQSRSGVANQHTAIGFQVSNQAYMAAKQLNLIRASGAVEYLLSDEYDTAPHMATGVGIRISNNENQKNMLFLNPSSNVGGGEAAGWYPVLDGSPQNIGSLSAGYHRYIQNYNASLEAIPGQTIHPGLVKATATVVVKVQ